MKKPFCNICDQMITDQRPHFKKLNFKVGAGSDSADITLDIVQQPEDGDYCTACIRKATVTAFDVDTAECIR